MTKDEEILALKARIHRLEVEIESLKPKLFNFHISDNLTRAASGDATGLHTYSWQRGGERDDTGG